MAVNDYIYKMGTAPNTRAAVSQKNKIYSYTVGGKGFKQLGAISEFGFDESRAVDPIRGVGFGDMIAELVPGVTEPMSLTLNKTLLYTANIFQQVGYKGGIDGLVRSLRHHRWPVDSKQELVFSEIAGNLDPHGLAVKAQSQPTDATGILTEIKALFTFYEGCWFTAYNASFTSDAAMVSESSTVTVTDVIDGTSTYGEFIDSGLVPKGSSDGYSMRFTGAQ